MATILIVDDRAINRQFLCTLLGYGGHELIEAEDGEVALTLARKRRPDLMIADILMPNMDGTELARRFQSESRLREVPIIFYTATYRLQDARELAATCGVARVLAKPAEPQLILSTVAELLGEPAAPVSPADAPAIAFAWPAGRDSEGLSLRLAALLELGLELNLQRDPQQLIELCCRAAQDIVNARYSGVAVVGADGGWERMAVRGLPGELDARLWRALIDPAAGAWGAAMRGGRLLRLEGDEVDGLPAGHPPVRHLLVVPLRTASRCYGWLYLAERLGDGRFGDSEEQLALALAAQLAQCYENLAMLEQVSSHAARLEREIGEKQQAWAALQESESRFRQLAENIREVFYLVVADLSQVLYISPAFEAIWGVECERLYREPTVWMECIHTEDVPRVEREVEASRHSGRFEAEYRIVRPDGGWRWIQDRAFAIRDGDGEIYRLAGIAEDVTERREHLARISRLSRILAVLSGINSAIVRIRDRDELLREACQIAVEKGGFRLAWIGQLDAGEGRVVASWGGQPEEVARLRFGNDDSLASQALRERRPVVRDLPPGASDRSLAAFPWRQESRGDAVIVLHADENGFFDSEELRLLNELVGDIRFGLEYIAREQRLAYLALYDPLTDLPNRKLLLDHLALLLAGARHEHQQLAVVVLDLDHFHQINDGIGRHVGDQLLRLVAQRWREVLPESYSLGRLEADIFAVVLADLPNKAEAVAILRRSLLDALERPFSLQERSIRLEAHAGIALFPGDADDAEALLGNAEIAVKQAKQRGETYLYFDTATNAAMTEKLALEDELRTALEEGRFLLHYQPRVDLVSGLIVGAEALLRWQHPQRGMVSPARFIPLAEETGLILPLGKWVIDTVCAQQAAWLARKLPIVPVAINLSAAQFGREGLLLTLQEALGRHGLDSRYLELELTESAVMQNAEQASVVLQSFRKLGLKLSLDDFGTGYSSLAYLKRFPFDFLKIDRAFVTDITSNPDDAAIATAIIALARQLKLRTVAEGVENEEQLEFLRRHGCNEIQGFYFSRPLPAEDFAVLLLSGRRLAPATLIGERILLLVGLPPLGVKNWAQLDGYRLLFAADTREALELLGLQKVQVVATGLAMPDMPCEDFLGLVEELYPEAIGLSLEGDASEKTLRQSIRDAFARYKPPKVRPGGF